MQDDIVYYSGSKFSGELNGKIGVIHAPVRNEDGVFVVEFDCKNGDYILSVYSLTKARPPKNESGPMVVPRRKRKQDEDV